MIPIPPRPTGRDPGHHPQALAERLARRALDAHPPHHDGATVVVFSPEGLLETVVTGPDIYAVGGLERPDAGFAALVHVHPDWGHHQVRVVGRGLPPGGYVWEHGPTGVVLLPEHDPLASGLLNRILIHHSIPTPPRWADWVGRYWLFQAACLAEATRRPPDLTPSAMTLFASPPVALKDLASSDPSAPRPITPLNRAASVWLIGRDWSWAHHQLAAGADPALVPAAWAQWAGARLTAWALERRTRPWRLSAARLAERGLDEVVATVETSLRQLGAR